MELTYNIIGWIYRNSDEYVDSNAFNNLMKVLNINMINNLVRPQRKYDDYADSYDILNNFYIELVPDSSSQLDKTDAIEAFTQLVNYMDDLIY